MCPIKMSSRRRAFITAARGRELSGTLFAENWT